MPTKYNVVSKRNPADPSAPLKYYPSVIAGGRITLRQLANRLRKSPR